MRKLLSLIGASLVLCQSAFGQMAASPQTPQTPAAKAKPVSPLGTGVNFGNMLEAPSEGAWGLTVEERFFDAAAASGIEHIRLPISWTHHADTAPPYTIDPAFMDRVEWCVDQALARGLKIIVNVHHYDALNADPIAESPRALAIWQQIAARFADRSNRRVFFEVLNEPHGAFNDDATLWDAYLTDALAVIRASNPSRWVLAGPVRWNSIAALESFNPPADPRLMLTVHHYEPFAFTHQGASWVDPSPPVGAVWTGNEHAIATPWQNWSWGTGVSSVDAGLSIDYQQGWAGLSFRRGSEAEGIAALRFTTNSAMSLTVIVGNETQQHTVALQTAPGLNEYTVQLPTTLKSVDRVTLQNATPNAQPPFVLSSIALDPIDGSVPEALFMSEAEAVDAAMRAASDWASARNMPAHLGEFGAYSPGDMDSRARWTRAVREAAERHAMAWAYWELAAGFGYFDPQTDTFRQPLLDALTD